MPETVPPTSPTPIAFAPLPVPIAGPALQPIRPSRKRRASIPSNALIPLFYAALFYLAGIVVAHFVYLRPGPLLVSLLPLALIAILTLMQAPRLTWLPIGCIWLILGAWSAETEPLPAPDPALLSLSNGLLRTVEGVVTDAGPIRELDAQDDDSDESVHEPAPLSAARLSQRIDLKLTAAEVVTDLEDSLAPLSNASSAKLRLTVLWPSNAPSFIPVQPADCGQRIRAVVRFLPPDTYRDPGVWSRATYLEAQDVTATGSVIATKSDGDAPRFELIGQPASSATCLLNRWRNFTSARLEALPALSRRWPAILRARPEDAAMLTALLTGDRTYLTRGIRDGFERTGSFHLIVVSGLHLAILAGCIFAVARRLRIPPLPTTALTLAVTLAYALFTGFAIPAQRSFWMIALYLIGRLLYRNRSPLNVIGFATLCLAAASPRSIFDANLQMTVISVAAIAGIALPLLERTLHARLKATRNLRLISLDAKLPPRIAQFRVTLRLIARHLEPATSPRIAWRFFPFLLRTSLRLGELLFVTLVVELALALPMAIYFHRITVYALPVNLFVLPLLGLLLPAAMLLLLVLALWPAATVVPAAAALFLLHLSVGLVRKLGALSLGDLRVPGPAAWQVGAALLLFVLAILLARELFGKHRSIALIALAGTAAVSLWPRPIDHPAQALLFEAIDVGQGDSLLLITPDGKTLLVDGGGIGFQPFGSASASHSEFDIGEEVVSAVLWSRGIRRLDAVALTHAHHDHMGGLPAILRNFHPRELWIGNNPPVPPYTALLQQAASLGIPVRSLRSGDQLTLGQATLRVLAPNHDYRPGPQPKNNDSLVLQASYGDTSILLEGDAEAPLEHALLADPAGLRSTVLKIGHHGSLTSTRPEFLAGVAPGWAVISCGRRNRFGHPRPEILTELESAHVRTLSTDTGGASCLQLNGKTVTADPGCRVVP